MTSSLILKKQERTSDRWDGKFQQQGWNEEPQKISVTLETIHFRFDFFFTYGTFHSTVLIF